MTSEFVKDMSCLRRSKQMSHALQERGNKTSYATHVREVKDARAQTMLRKRKTAELAVTMQYVFIAATAFTSVNSLTLVPASCGVIDDRIFIVHGLQIWKHKALSVSENQLLFSQVTVICITGKKEKQIYFRSMVLCSFGVIFIVSDARFQLNAGNHPFVLFLQLPPRQQARFKLVNWWISYFR